MSPLRKTVRDFFQERTEWSEHKHRILKKYLTLWVSKLQARARGKGLAFVDTHAGPGRYEEPDGSDDFQDVSWGSPVIAARRNRFLEELGSHLTVYACETDPKAFQSLRHNLKRWIKKDPPLAKLYDAPFQDVLPEILDETRDRPTVVFIDPFKTKNLTLDTLAPVLEDKDREPTELILRVDAGIFARMTGWLSNRKRNPIDQAKAESFQRTLLRLGFTQKTLDQLLEGAGSGDRRDELLREYMTCFEEHWKWVVPIPIRASYDAAPKYHLLHCTDSHHGVFKMNDIVSTTDDEKYRAYEKDRVADQLFLAGLAAKEVPRGSLEDLEDFASKLIRTRFARSGATFARISAELAVEFGPEFRAKHHRKALTRLLEDGKISCDTGSVIREKSRITKAN